MISPSLSPSLSSTSSASLPSLSGDSHRLARLESLLLLEGELRQASSLQELIYCIVNEVRHCISSRQTFVLKGMRGRSLDFFIDAVSNISVIDRNAPAIRYLEHCFCSQLSAWHESYVASPKVCDTDNSLTFTFSLPESCDTTRLPFRHGLALPLLDRRGTSTLYGAVIMLSEKPFSSAERIIAARLQSAFNHAWLALRPRPFRRIQRAMSRSFLFVSLSIVFFSLFLPVSLTSLAPVEVVAHRPHIVAAPIDGVVAGVDVAPNSVVSAGTVLFRYRDTQLKTALSIAEKGRDVALARFRTAQQSSFSSASSRRELAIAEAELSLAQAELSYAQDRLAQTIVRAPVSGLVVFDRRTDWQGRPVSIGERIVEIADPSRIEYRIDLSVSDSIVLDDDVGTSVSGVRVFLDSDPLSVKSGILDRAGYRATKSRDDRLVYELYALPLSDGLGDGLSDDIPRIGSRGTAQVFSGDVPLGFYLLRRPLSVIRQSIGL